MCVILRKQPTVKTLTMSVRSSETHESTVKRPSPLWDKAADKQLVLGCDYSCQTWNLFVSHRGLSWTYYISSCTLQRRSLPTTEWEKSAAPEIWYTPPHWVIESLCMTNRHYRQNAPGVFRAVNEIQQDHDTPKDLTSSQRLPDNCGRCLKPTAKVAK